MRVEPVPRRLICVATAALILAACGQKQSAPPPTPEVGVVTVKTSSVPVVTELSGRRTHTSSRKCVRASTASF